MVSEYAALSGSLRADEKVGKLSRFFACSPSQDSFQFSIVVLQVSLILLLVWVRDLGP